MDVDMARIRDEATRLSAENARLCAENARLLEENRSLRANAYCPPSLVEAFRDALGTTLGAGVNECSHTMLSTRSLSDIYVSTVLRDAQEQRAARLEAERKLAEFQEQLKKVFYRQHDPGGLAFTSCR